MTTLGRRLIVPVAVAATLGLGLVGGTIGRAQDASPAASPAAGMAASPAASPIASPAANAATVVIEGFDIGWTHNGQSTAPGQPIDVAVAPGTTISLPNVGAAPHNFVADALGLYADMPVGQTVEVTIPADAAPGTYEFICDVPGHAPAGMVGTLTIG